MGIIRLPDGTRAQFPDDMPVEEITDVLGAYHHFSERMGIEYNAVQPVLPHQPLIWKADEVAAMGEIALMAGSGTYGKIAGGLTGLRERLHGREGGDVTRQVMQDRTYQPRTDAGRRTMQAIGQGVTSAIAASGLDGVKKWWREDAVKTMQDHFGIAGGAAFAAFGIGALATLLEISPIPGGKVLRGVGQRQRGMFGGTNARTADLEALEQAKVLEQHGADRDQIWTDTGWMHDRDGQWKFEIDDSEARLNSMFRDDLSSSVRGFGEKYNQAPVTPDVMGHGELYDAYGDLGTVGVQDNPGGVRLIAQDATFLGPGSDKSLLLHETQHGIQHREGFAKGGSPNSEWFAGGKEVNAEWERIAKDMMEPTPFGKWLKSAWNDPEWSKNAETRKAARAGYAEYLEGHEKFVKDVNRQGVYHPLMVEAQKTAGRNVYQRLAGEAEARNVQTRMDMTADERRATPPWQTLDVPEDELIVRMQNSGLAESRGYYHGSDHEVGAVGDMVKLPDGTMRPLAEGEQVFYHGGTLSEGDAFAPSTPRADVYSGDHFMTASRAHAEAIAETSEGGQVVRGVLDGTPVRLDRVTVEDVVAAYGEDSILRQIEANGFPDDADLIRNGTIDIEDWAKSGDGAGAEAAALNSPAMNLLSWLDDGDGIRNWVKSRGDYALYPDAESGGELTATFAADRYRPIVNQSGMSASEAPKPKEVY